MTEQLDLFAETPRAGVSPAPEKAPEFSPNAGKTIESTSNVVALPIKRRRNKTGQRGPVLPTHVFPLSRRKSKVVDVATKLMATTTRRHELHYRQQVSDALRCHLESRRVPADRWLGEIARFWTAVELELGRRRRTPDHGPRGAA